MMTLYLNCELNSSYYSDCQGLVGKIHYHKDTDFQPKSMNRAEPALTVPLRGPCVGYCTIQSSSNTQYNSSIKLVSLHYK